MNKTQFESHLDNIINVTEVFLIFNDRKHRLSVNLKIIIFFFLFKRRMSKYY